MVASLNESQRRRFPDFERGLAVDEGVSAAASEADIRVTRDRIRAGQLLKIEVLDPVIMGRSTAERPKDYTCLRERGYFT